MLGVMCYFNNITLFSFCKIGFISYFPFLLGGGVPIHNLVFIMFSVVHVHFSCVVDFYFYWLLLSSVTIFYYIEHLADHFYFHVFVLTYFDYYSNLFSIVIANSFCTFLYISTPNCLSISVGGSYQFVCPISIHLKYNLTVFRLVLFLLFQSVFVVVAVL